MMRLVNPILLTVGIASLAANYIVEMRLEYIALGALCGLALVVLNRPGRRP